jgi:hypothetical protein
MELKSYLEPSIIAGLFSGAIGTAIKHYELLRSSPTFSKMSMLK